MKPDWRQNVLRVTPYTPGEQPAEKDILKLNTNENPYPPAKGVQELLRAFPADDLRKYPDPTLCRLKRALSETYGVQPERIFAGVGSDDVLAMAFLAFFSKGCTAQAPLLFADVTYSFYPVWAELFAIPFREIPLTDDYTLDTQAFIAEEGETPGGIVIANPNAPTGIAEKGSDLERIVRANPQCVVIVDEAYVDFGGESVLPLTDTYDNLLVVQTFSKSRSMAGMRVGFAFGSPDLIRSLEDVKYAFNSYTLNTLSILAGEAALKDGAYFKACCEKIIATREKTVAALEGLGYTCLPTATNFVFAKPPAGQQARAVFEHLRAQGIYVRYFDAPRTKDFLRITIGTDEEMKRLYAALKENG